VEGRRFTLEEKLIALSIMKKSLKSYKFFQRIFILPSGTTLKKMVQKLKVEHEINQQIFESIKEEVKVNKLLILSTISEESLWISTLTIINIFRTSISIHPPS